MLGFKGKLLDLRADDMDVQTLISIDFMYCICMLSSFAESIVSHSWAPSCLCACIHSIYTQDWLFPSASVPELEVQRPLGVAPDADHALGGKLVKKSTRRGT